jgi:quinol monooxygenase YgiN
MAVIRFSVLIVARRGEVNTLAAALRSISTQALGQPGCRSSRLSSDLTNPDALHYWEEWTTEAGFRVQLSSARFKRLLQLMEAGIEPPELEVQLVSRRTGLAYVEAILRGDAS